MSWVKRQTQRAKELRAQTYALYLACKHPGTPWYAKALAVCVVAYALTPIDLIRDFIPVIGHLDECHPRAAGRPAEVTQVGGPGAPEERRDARHLRRPPKASPPIPA